MCGHEAGSAQHNSLFWLLDPAPLARGLLPPKSLAWNVARPAAAASTSFFSLSAAFVAIVLDRAARSAGPAALRVRGWTSRVVLSR